MEWKPGLIVSDDSDETHEPRTKEERKVASFIKLSLLLASHRARIILATHPKIEPRTVGAPIVPKV